MVPSEVGGTHPVLLEAMCAGNCVVVNDHEPNLEVLGDAGLSYPGAEGAAGLRRALQTLLDHPRAHRRAARGRAGRARELYTLGRRDPTPTSDLIRAVIGRTAGVTKRRVAHSPPLIVKPKLPKYNRGRY